MLGNRGAQELWKERAQKIFIRRKAAEDRLTIERLIPVSALAAGRYTIEVTAIDLLTNETVIRSSDFTVKPTLVKPNAY